MAAAFQRRPGNRGSPDYVGRQLIYGSRSNAANVRKCFVSVGGALDTTAIRRFVAARWQGMGSPSAYGGAAASGRGKRSGATRNGRYRADAGARVHQSS